MVLLFILGLMIVFCGPALAFMVSLVRRWRRLRARGRKSPVVLAGMALAGGTLIYGLLVAVPMALEASRGSLDMRKYQVPALLLSWCCVWGHVAMVKLRKQSGRGIY